jgi:hypothetical protein
LDGWDFDCEELEDSGVELEGVASFEEVEDFRLEFRGGRVDEGQIVHDVQQVGLVSDALEEGLEEPEAQVWGQQEKGLHDGEEAPVLYDAIVEFVFQAPDGSLEQRLAVHFHEQGFVEQDGDEVKGMEIERENCMGNDFLEEGFILLGSDAQVFQF